MRVLVLAVVAAAGGCCGVPGFASCSPSGPPPTDSCVSGTSGTLGTIEIGAADDLFRAYHDGDAPHIVEGGQGLTMMGVRLRLTGADVPACLAQSTGFQDLSGMRLAGSSDPLKTYPESDGSFTTRPVWIPSSFPASFDIVTVVGSQTGRVRCGAAAPDMSL